MLQFENRTRFAGTMFASPDPDGIDSLYAVVKGTFDLTPDPVLAEEQVPVVLAAEHYGDPASTSIKTPADVGLVKPATDVLLVGHAYAPNGRPATYVDVWLSVGAMSKVVRVFGDRHWDTLGVGATISPPEPFQRMPLVWERAFGGTDEVDAQPVAENRNPVGTGYRAPKSSKPLDGMPLPNLEDPYAPITSPRSTPQPACFAPVAPHWEPRRSLAGTYDEAWQQTRAPYLPHDFDPRFLQLAPPGLVAPGYLRGGEPVEVRGATGAGLLAFRLPAIDVRVTVRLDREQHTLPANLDTVIIEPDVPRLQLVWRAGYASGKKTMRVREIAVDALDAA